MQIQAPETHPLAASTVLCAACLALLLVSYIAIGVGMARLLRVQLPAAVQSHMVRF
ncbi:MAG TPA: hypothetical protein VFV95_19445 [Vicinamibacterales bacterium]|nr:hypothetical protein [Vicinamibacterales bacterium]